MSTLERLERAFAEAENGEWGVDNYICHHAIKGGNNAFGSRIVVAGREIAHGMDHRWKRPPNDPGECPNATWVVLSHNAWPRIRDVLRAVERHETAMALWRKTVGMEHGDERVRMVDEAEHNIYEGREDMRVAWRKLEEEGGDEATDA